MGDGNGKIRVVVCDDVAQLRLLYRRWLEREPDMEFGGEASDGVEALALVERADPDVVLLDIQMPVMNGLEVLERISSSHPRTKVLVLTGLSPARLEQDVHGLGASDLIEKGTDLKEVGERIRAAVAAE